MKKMIITLVAAIVAATATYAQSSMLATLSHEGNISTFYGASALKEAYNAAANGDVITLSSGSFNAVKLEKAVTIRGAGMGIDNLAQVEPTVITGDFEIAIPETVTERLTIEGIYHNHTITVTNLKNGTFLKDRFYKIQPNGYPIKNLTMIHCKVVEELWLETNSSVSCVNCYINKPAGYQLNFEFVNCVLNKNNTWNEIHNSSFKNCILRTASNSYILNSDNVVYNCVAVGTGNDILFNNIPNTTNSFAAYADVFKTYTGTYNDNETFELTEAAKTTYLGIDGTQVGMYGGNMPFSATPTNPQITKCNVAAKSTADGKLSVDITVNGAE